MGGRTTFPRLSGGIVLDSFSLVSFFTGLVLALPAGLVALVGGTGPHSSGAGSAASLVWAVTALVAVSRFAQLGIAGDTEGGLFSGTVGPWSGTFLAAARLLVLWVVWLVPIIAWALLRGKPQPSDAAPAFGLAPVPVPHVPFLLGLWAAATVLLSFAFVSVAAAAPGFASLFSPGLWRALFGGRLGELLVVIAGTFGPPLTVFVVVTPVLSSYALSNPKLALTSSLPFFLYAVGMVLTLEGKLCGAFSAASLVEETGAADEGLLESVVEQPGAVASLPVAAGIAPPSAPAAPPAGDPKALHADWKARRAAGDVAGAIAVAREMIPAGLAKGEPRAAAEVYRHHLDRLGELGLDRTALDLLADQLLKDGDPAAAAWTFSQALDSQPTDPKAFKGLLRVADHHLEKAKQPSEAVRIYRYLLERAPTSPFAEHARDLLADAERKAARPAAPQA